MAKKENRRDKILEMVYRCTIRYLQAPAEGQCGIHAARIGEQLGLDRANVSRELNSLYKSGELIKCLGKPTLYLHRSALFKAYPQTFIPSTIPRDKTLAHYLDAPSEPEPALLSPTVKTSDIQVGTDGSLAEAFAQASAAIMYPPHGLPILITGGAGAGKLRFAQEVHRFSVSRSILSPDAPFVVCDCREYSETPRILIAQLFGESKSAERRGRRGLLEKASGGILCLDGIESLDVSIQKRLSKLLENRSFSRIGESGVTRYSSAMLIALSSGGPSTSLDTFARSFPVQLAIPNLDDRGLDELFAYISLFFREEATSTGVSFRVVNDTIVCLLSASYPGNVNELISCIKTICSLAFRDYVLSGMGNGQAEVSMRHLPSNLLRRIAPSQERTAAVQRLLSGAGQGAMVFSPGSSPVLTLPSRQPEGEPPSEEERVGIPILLLLHGDGVAELVAAHLNELCGETIVTGVSYGGSEDLEGYIQRVAQLAEQLDRGNGVLLAADMEPLSSLHERITKRSGVPAATITDLGLSALLTVSRLAMRTGQMVQEFVQRSLPGQLHSTQQSYLEQIITKILTPSLTFLNPQKAASALLLVLNKVLEDLSVGYSDEIALRFIFHGAHMIERLIRGQSLRYERLRGFANTHAHIFSSLENRMQYISASFGIVIPTSELAYIAEIFL